MLINIIAAAAVPDVWVATADGSVGAVPSALMSIGIVVAWFALVNTVVTAVDHAKREMLLSAAVMVAGIVAAVVCGALLHDATSAHDEEAATGKSAYFDSVATWLSDDYDIDTNPETLRRLVAGEALTAEYDGRQVVISLGETTTGRLSVVDENRTVLERMAD
jgi:hypothetical protein